MPLQDHARPSQSLHLDHTTWRWRVPYLTEDLPPAQPLILFLGLTGTGRSWEER